MSSAALISGVEWGIRKVFKEVNDKTVPEFNRFMYNVLGYYTYNGCLLAQVVVGVVLPIFRLFGGISFATGFWFLVVAEIIKRPIFRRLIQDEVFKTPVEKEVDAKKKDDAPHGCVCANNADREYLKDRRNGDDFPNEERSRRVLLARGQNPEEHRGFSAGILIFGFLEGFGHMGSPKKS